MRASAKFTLSLKSNKKGLFQELFFLRKIKLFLQQLTFTPNIVDIDGAADRRSIALCAPTSLKREAQYNLRLRARFELRLAEGILKVHQLSADGSLMMMLRRFIMPEESASRSARCS